jgi:hypothetical protein
MMIAVKFTKLLIALVFLTSLCGAVAAQKPLAPAAKKELPVKVFGIFMRIKSNGEHAYGYSVELWQQGAKIYGLISAHDGLIGDPPTGLLENVKFDPKTKKFSFRAKLTLGMVFSKEYDNVPSRDVFEFQGTLTKMRLAGTLSTTNELCPDKCPEKKKINLPRSRVWDSAIRGFKTYAEWKADADETLKSLGPEW